MRVRVVVYQVVFIFPSRGDEIVELFKNVLLEAPSFSLSIMAAVA